MSRNILRLSSILLITLYSFTLGAEVLIVAGEKPSLHIDFDECASFGDGSNSDYSEFTAEVTVNDLCSGLSLLGGYVYRDSSHYNMHSCAPGFEDVAMCIAAADSCTYDSEDDKALKFDVRVVPGPDGLGSIDQLSFYERSPEEFTFLEGPTGPNNYPLHFTLRVLANNQEIFRMEDVETNREWTQQSFDFSDHPQFLVSDTTIFNFEILPYCLAGIDSPVQAWDIDELTITGGCHNVRGGVASTGSPDVICAKNAIEGRVEFEVQDAFGDNMSWFVVGSNDLIFGVSEENFFQFDMVPSGEYTIYHIAFTDDLEGLEVGGRLSELSGCYDLSNGLQITNIRVRGGRLSIDGAFMAFLCTSDGVDENIVVDLEFSSGSELLYIVTDSVNVILKTQLSDTFNFEGTPAGQCLIYAMTYEGVISNTEAGNNITDLEGCFALSSPFGIFRSTAFPGMISVNQQQSITICNQDSIDLLDIELVNAEAESESWIVTNAVGEIIEFNVSEPIDISSYAPGSYQIYHLAYSGTVSALNIGENINNLSGCIGLSNALDVEKVNVEGGDFSIVGGATEIEICSKAIVDAFDVELLGAVGDTSIFVLTNADGVIIDLPENTPIDFNESTSEECFLWALSYSDISGLSIGNHIDDFEGCYAFSNAITINKVLLDAGFLALSNNSACIGDGVPDLVGGNIFNASGPVSQLIITDNDSIILDVINQFPFDVENASGGTCLVFHVSSLDTLELFPGMNVNDISECHDISNSGVVLRTDIHAGAISLDDGGTSIHICVSDTISDVLSFINTSTAGKNIQYVVTDTNNVILALPDSSVVDFSISPPGICLVWAVSYTGNFVAMVGETLGQMPPSDGCVDITDNYVEVARDSVGGPCDPECIVDGGFVDLFGNEYCIGDGIEDFVTGSVQNALGLYQQILLTDTAGIILAVSDSINFEVDGADPGTCLVWNLAALDTIQLNAGMSIDSIDSNCFDLSPPSSFNRLNPEGGLISYPGGDTLTQTICVGDSLPDVLVFIRDTVTIPLYKYIIANEENIVIAVAPNNSFNFENLLPGICKVYGVSYSGLFTLSQGDTLFVDPPATGCFDYSDNCLNIVKEDCSTTSCPVDGGSLELSTNFVCVSDGEDDLVDGDVQNAIGDYSTYIITDTDSIIIGNPPNFPINFESAGGGICLVWHMSAMDSIPLNMGDHINSITDCHDLSEPETIERVDNNGGSVSLDNGATIIEICVGDSVANELVFSTSGFSVNYEYIITDTFDVIIDVVDNNIIDFENAPAGVCRVYGLAHNDVFDQMAGDTLELPDNPGTCFDLSDNFVEVIRIDSGAPCTNKLTGSEIVFAINPNPSTGYINLEFESIPELKADISIFSAHGVKQYHEMIEGVTQYNELQLPEFAPGTYFVRVRSQSKVLTKKFLVVR